MFFQRFHKTSKHLYNNIFKCFLVLGFTAVIPMSSPVSTPVSSPFSIPNTASTTVVITPELQPNNSMHSASVSTPGRSMDSWPITKNISYWITDFEIPWALMPSETMHELQQGNKLNKKEHLFVVNTVLDSMLRLQKSWSRSCPF